KNMPASPARFQTRPRRPSGRGTFFAAVGVEAGRFTKETSMANTNKKTATPPKPKKSVALSGVIAGDTALCTVGRSGNDLHYRGYDILDLAANSEFEEIAHLLVHGSLPTRAE